MPIKEGSYEINIEETDDGKPKDKKTEIREGSSGSKTLQWEV